MVKCLKIVLIFLLINMFFSIDVQASNEVMEAQKNLLNISEFIKEANNYSKESFPELDMNEVLNSAIKGEIRGDFWKKAIYSVLGKEVTNSIRTLGIVLIIIILHSILKSLSESLENKGISQIVYYVEYILIVTLIMVSFSEMVVLTRDTIEKMVGFMNLLVPILITLMITTGNIVTANIIQPIILFLISFIGNMINIFALPLVLISAVLGIVSNISDKIQINKLSKYFNSSIVWALGIILTIFVGVISIEGTMSSSVDGITAKATKAVVSDFIPVVGKILGDAVDTVLGCAAILKNAVGIVGVFVVLGICVMPIIKLTVLTISYYLTTAISQIIADEKIVKLLEHISNSFKILLAILFSISTMLIIGVALVIKISNSGLMYR